MKNFLFIIVLLFSLPSYSLANISISSFFLKFQADSPKRTDLVRFTNISSETKTYRISLINYKQEKNGKYQKITTPLKCCPFASKYLNFSPHETTLKPRQSQVIRIQRKAMAAAKDGEYISHLMIQEMPTQNIEPSVQKKENTLNFSVKALYKVTIPIIIQKGTLSNRAKISNYTIEKKVLTVTLKRFGNSSFKGILIIKNGKKEIARLNDFRIFLSTNERVFKIALKDNLSLKNGSIILLNADTKEKIDEVNL